MGALDGSQKDGDVGVGRGSRPRVVVSARTTHHKSKAMALSVRMYAFQSGRSPQFGRAHKFIRTCDFACRLPVSVLCLMQYTSRPSYGSRSCKLLLLGMEKSSCNSPDVEHGKQAASERPSHNGQPDGKIRHRQESSQMACQTPSSAVEFEIGVVTQIVRPVIPLCGFPHCEWHRRVTDDLQDAQVSRSRTRRRLSRKLELLKGVLKAEAAIETVAKRRPETKILLAHGLVEGRPRLSPWTGGASGGAMWASLGKSRPRLDVQGSWPSSTNDMSSTYSV
ncbi:hypothetical protein M409DRAFT_57872 [Zasmidium cellare ATCC 36951]|uniref:Uncharacterized protein n=1 Tax=Zasmidium cellare ATCC 36951 TaxID=1080233 RepID=A0A6A6C990_ZASCE|nr:uncharacterized protein M409DRAFT_57872 [Zasmidium cellare ATCC 36951]KAF2162810.1 hypothetical protein M409DRAFT_57872 [Zasmidium cellare ATCC 36951]